MVKEMMITRVMKEHVRGISFGEKGGTWITWSQLEMERESVAFVVVGFIAVLYVKWLLCPFHFLLSYSQFYNSWNLFNSCLSCLCLLCEQCNGKASKFFNRFIHR